MKRTESRTGRRILLILTLLILLFIWGHSLVPEADSKAESGWLRETIVNPLLGLVGLGPVSDYFVRKAAHVTEYLFFGLAAALCWRGKLPQTLLTAFLAAFLDETIQVFSHRGAQIRDVWIDLIGAAAGSLLGALIVYLKNRNKN